MIQMSQRTSVKTRWSYAVPSPASNEAFYGTAILIHNQLHG